MSTRSNLAIKLNTEDLNCDLHLKMEGKEVANTVNATESAPYLQIYCHHDGYLSYMGALLVKHQNYDEALNIILHGDTSALDEDENGNLTTEAYAPDEGFEDGDAPRIMANPSLDEEYLYVFKNGKWYVDEGSGLFDLQKLMDAKEE